MLRNKIQQFRGLHGLSRDDLGKAVGLTRQTIHLIETDPGYMPSAETMVRLANYFNCDLGRLFYIERSPVGEK